MPGGDGTGPMGLGPGVWSGTGLRRNTNGRGLGVCRSIGRRENPNYPGQGGKKQRCGGAWLRTFSNNNSS